MADIAAEVIMNDIPDQLIINWDQTGLSVVPTGQWTMHHVGEKIIPIANVDDKRQITAVGRSNPGCMCMNLYKGVLSDGYYMFVCCR